MFWAWGKPSVKNKPINRVLSINLNAFVSLSGGTVILNDERKELFM